MTHHDGPLASRHVQSQAEGTSTKQLRKNKSLQIDDSGPAAAFPNERGNVARLAVAQALAGANATVIFATGAVVGNTLAPDKALATLPVTVFVIGTAAATLPAGALAQRFGRRVGDSLPNLFRTATARRAGAVEHGRAPLAARGPIGERGGGEVPW